MKKTRPKHIIITFLKTTGRENLKRNRLKKTSYMDRSKEDFSWETRQMRRQWSNIFKILGRAGGML